MRGMLMWIAMSAVGLGCAPTGDAENSGGHPGTVASSSGATSGGGSSNGGAGSSSGTTSSSGGASGSSSGGSAYSSGGIFGVYAPRCAMDFTRGGVLELRYVYHNRQDGLVDWIELQDGQAVLQSTYHFQYDNQGRVSSEESRDTAGTATLRIAYHYNAHGVLETTDRDTDADGDVDARTTHVYDAQGRRVEDATDNDLDGTVDATVSYVNNELGDPERVTTTAPGYTAIDHYQYGLPGRVSTIDTDFVGDGEVDRRSTYHYDADGRWSSSDGDAQVDGTVDWRWVVSYDC